MSNWDTEYETEHMSGNVSELSDAVVGHRIVKAERTDNDRWYSGGLEITLDNGKKVVLRNTSDCCAYTDLDDFWLNPELVDHMIMGVTTDDRFYVWHIYADMGDILKLTVAWSSGNTGYYGFGFDIRVEDVAPPATDFEKSTVPFWYES
jgi:hypothetical protein